MVRDYSAFLPNAAPARRAPTALEALGWGPAFASQIDLEALTETPPVRVVAVHRNGLQVAGDGINTTIPPGPEPHLKIQVRPVANCVRCDRELTTAFPALVGFSRFDFSDVTRTTCFASHTFGPSHCFESSHALRFSLEMMIDPAWWQSEQTTSIELLSQQVICRICQGRHRPNGNSAMDTKSPHCLVFYA